MLSMVEPDNANNDGPDHDPHSSGRVREDDQSQLKRSDKIRATLNEPWASPIATLIGALLAAAVASIVLGIQFGQANDLAESYQGAQQCKDYRDEVLKLEQLGLTDGKIVQWLQLESDTSDPSQHGQSFVNKEKYCGHVHDLTMLLPLPPPSPRPTRRCWVLGTVRRSPSRRVPP